MIQPFTQHNDELRAHHSRLKNEEGYILILVTVMGLILAIIFSAILPQLHTAQQTRAYNNLNEARAYEAARSGIKAVELGMRDVNNFQELTGYVISGVTTPNIFDIKGKYASLFASGTTFQVYFSTGNDGEYTSTGATDFITGVTTMITVSETITSGTTYGVISRNRGLLWALDTALSDFYEYRDEDGNIQFVSGCSGIDVSTAALPNDKSGLYFGIIISRGGATNYPDTDDGDTDPRNDGVYFYNNGEKGTVTGSPLLSEDNPPSSITWTDFLFTSGSIDYGDFDMNGTTQEADFKFFLENNEWYAAVGNKGSYRGQYSGTELWNVRKDFFSGTTPFMGKDNDGDGVVDASDEVQVLVFVRSRGITTAAGSTYGSGNTSDLNLVNDINSNLPNPRPQLLEGAFFLEDEQ